MASLEKVLVLISVKKNRSTFDISAKNLYTKTNSHIVYKRKNIEYIDIFIDFKGI